MANLDFLATVLCPLLGVLICNAMFLSPFLAVMEARKHKKLGKISPFPFAMVTICQIGWTIYAYMGRDYYIFFSSCFGIIVGLLLCFTAIHLLERPHHSKYEETERLAVEMILLVGVGYWIFITFIATIVLDPAGSPKSALMAGKIISGSAAGCSLLYYGIPLSNMKTIVESRDSSSLHFPTLCINLLNCCLWYIYGLIAIRAPAVFIPNSIGAALTAVNIVLCLMYPSKSSADLDGEETASTKSNKSTSACATQSSTTGTNFSDKLLSVRHELISSQLRTDEEHIIDLEACDPDKSDGSINKLVELVPQQ
jgi:uncharacterized protein with PQ loop repeat